MKTILTNCTVIDCTGQPPLKDMTVVIEGDRIADLKLGSYQPADGEGEVRTFDLEGGYVLPGLWDVHVHLFEPKPEDVPTGEAVIAWAIQGGRQMMDALRAGITGIRVAGDGDFMDIAWKEAFNAGVFVGPRMFVSGRALRATGGHGCAVDVEVDGPYEMRREARENLKHGADWIKLMVTGGIGTAGETMYESQLLLDEIEAATVVAHQKGKRVFVHAGGPAGVKTAIRGGVDCIEHGYWLDDEAIEMMVEKGVFYVPTLSVAVDETLLDRPGLPDYHVKKARAGAKLHLESFQKALKAGVRIACGSDSAGELSLRAIEHLAKGGMGEMGALIAATRTSADLCEVGDDLGTMEVGKLADLIVVSANPLEDISNIRKLKLVLKGGNVVETDRPEGLADLWDCT